MIELLKADYPVRDICAALEVSRSGYYAWRNRPESPRAQANKVLETEIQGAFTQSRKTYGCRRIAIDLKEDGVDCSKNRVARIMKSIGLQARPKRGYRPVTTDSNHSSPVAPNRLADQEPPVECDEAWVADITYIRTDEGWLYLAAVMDLYSRRILGWAMQERMDTSLPLSALHMALNRRAQRTRDPLHHSDRGSQYASDDYAQTLQTAELVPSMSRKGCCYDNAAMESFWSTLKIEQVYRTRYKTRAEAKRAIFDYIECFYNTNRRHSSLGYKSPVDFENQMN